LASCKVLALPPLSPDWPSSSSSAARASFSRAEISSSLSLSEDFFRAALGLLAKMDLLKGDESGNGVVVVGKKGMNGRRKDIKSFPDR
jgi:hypothetical protein